MSPERINGDEYNFASDIWSFGNIYFHVYFKSMYLVKRNGYIWNGDWKIPILTRQNSNLVTLVILKYGRVLFFTSE